MGIGGVRHSFPEQIAAISLRHRFFQPLGGWRRDLREGAVALIADLGLMIEAPASGGESELLSRSN